MVIFYLKNNSKKAELYANCILLKGKNAGNETKIADGYLFLYKSKIKLFLIYSIFNLKLLIILGLIIKKYI